MYRELLIGCGSEISKRICSGERKDWVNLVTLDLNIRHRPDVVADLEVLPLPFGDAVFDEIHAYEVLEHTGQQGDWRFFFAQFTEFHRILKVGGVFVATVPRWDSIWAWGDPSHKRIINVGSLVFLDQDEYVKQVGVTSMSDFRFCYTVSFKREYVHQVQDGLQFILRKDDAAR